MHLNYLLFFRGTNLSFFLIVLVVNCALWFQVNFAPPLRERGWVSGQVSRSVISLLSFRFHLTLYNRCKPCRFSLNWKPALDRFLRSRRWMCINANKSIRCQKINQVNRQSNKSFQKLNLSTQIFRYSMFLRLTADVILKIFLPENRFAET